MTYLLDSVGADLLHTALDEVVATCPETSITFPDDDVRITAGEVASASSRWAAEIAAHGVGHGAPVGILCPTGPDFVIAFYAILRAGGCALPMPLPSGLRNLDRYVAEMGGVLRHSGTGHLVVADSVADIVSKCLPSWPSLDVMRPAELDEGSGSLTRIDGAAPGDTCTLQYTSGSTGSPKGIVISHANAFVGFRAVVEAGKITPRDVNGQWVPLSHDMGLVCCNAFLLGGIDQFLWPPVAFARGPAEWLRDFASCGATINQAPNFSFEYLLAEVDEGLLSTLDLSSWRVAFNGGELVSPTTVERFHKRFAPAGFRPGVMSPCYGLAEATLAVTVLEPGSDIAVESLDLLALADHRVEPSRPGRSEREVVGVGPAVLDMSLRIVDEDGRAVEGPDRVGEIQIRGAAVSSGYFRAPDETASAFDAGWYSTGDLGFVRDSQLFVVGRVKEMLKSRGLNLHADDLEYLVRDLPGVYRKRCAAFNLVDDAGEHVGFAAETDLTDPGERAALGRRIASEIASGAGLTELSVYLVPPRSIPRTPSGKLQRFRIVGLVAGGVAEKIELEASSPTAAWKSFSGR